MRRICDAKVIFYGCVISISWKAQITGKLAMSYDYLFAARP